MLEQKFMIVPKEIEGNHGFLFQHFYAPNLTLSTLTLVGLKSILILGSVPIAYFFFSLFMLNREAHFTKYQSQLLQVMFLWLIVRHFLPPTVADNIVT